MPIAFKCPGCGKDYKVPDEFGGRSSKCRQCGATMAIPQASAAVSATPQPPAAPPSAPAAPTFGQKVKARMIQQAKWRLIGCGVTAALVSVCCVCGGIFQLISGRSATTSKLDTAVMA